MTRMPVISSCQESDCYYNRELACHAPAITVGSAHPTCDTFAPSASHISRADVGLVGACHVAECRYNVELTCGAVSIAVAQHQDHPDCGTYAPRS